MPFSRTFAEMGQPEKIRHEIEGSTYAKPHAKRVLEDETSKMGAN